MTIFFVMFFEEDVEFTLATILFNELEDAKKNVNNAPGFASSNLAKLPELLLQKFPKEKFSELDPKKYLILNVTLFTNHINNIEKVSEYLADLRQYIHYHIHSSKTYLHSRIRKKVNLAHRQINLVKFESDDIKIYRSRRGEGVEVDFKPKDKNPNDIIFRAK